MRRKRFLLVILAIACAVPAAAQDPTPAEGADVGSIEGRVVKDGKGIGGVTVLVQETKAVQITDRNGRFRFLNLPRGTYLLLFTRGDNNEARPGVEVSGGLKTELQVEVEWKIGMLETLTVYSVSKRMEKIVDAPAAITVVPEAQIQMEASTGQVPKLLEFTPGAEITQSGIYDFNVNTRGFNSSVNRRVATYLDGRDMSAPFLGAQEWSALSTPIDDLANLEFIRGPSAALYGRNSSAGVINMRSKAPRDSIGGTARLTTNVGDVDTTNADIRWAGELGKGWYVKAVGGFRFGDDFTKNRNALFIADGNDLTTDDPTITTVFQAEYTVSCGFDNAGSVILDQENCLPVEAVPRQTKDNQIFSGILRFDKYFSEDNILTLEGGYAGIEGPVFQTGIGRVETIDSKRPYFRAAFGSRHYNAIAYVSQREAEQRNLQSGEPLFTDTTRWSTEFQTNWDIGGGRGRIVGGLAYTLEEVDTASPLTGEQTLINKPLEEDYEAIFAQFDWKFGNKVKLVAAGRFDDSSLFKDVQFSPKLALVWSVTPSHSIRFTYNEAFQVPNYSEFFLRVDVLPPQDLSFLQDQWCDNTTPPVDCEIGETRFLAVGNESLDLEQTKAWEIGYSAIIGKKLFLTIDYYNANNKDFITDLLFQCQAEQQPPTLPDGTPNPDFFLPRCGNDVALNDLVNPAFDSWDVPAGQPNPSTGIPKPGGGTFSLEDVVNNSFARILGDPNSIILSNDPDNGEAVVAVLSYTNFGEVNTQGVDVGVNYFIKDWLNLRVTYSWFDFDPVIPQCTSADSDTCAFEDERTRERLLPNTPKNKFAIGLGYNRGKWQAGIGFRWTEDFRWSAGIFRGDVAAECQPGPDAPSDACTNRDPSYSQYWGSTPYYLLDLDVSYRVNPNWQIGLNAANAVDKPWNQSYGGDLIGRRALLSALYSWGPGL